MVSATKMYSAPWSFGEKVAKAANSAEAITSAGLDWTVSKRPQQYQSADGTQTFVNPNWFVVARDDNDAPLGTVGKGYKPLQNAEAFQVLDSLVEGGELEYETAGYFGRGERIWALARVPKGDFEVAGDQNKGYILLANGHDGKLGVRGLPTTVRVVCSNTLAMALARGDGEGFRIRHSQQLNQRIQEGKKVLKKSLELIQGFAQTAERLAKTAMSKSNLQTFVEKAVGNVYQMEAASGLDAVIAATVADESLKERRYKEMLNRVLENYENERNTLPGIAGTAWAAFNAFTEEIDHGSKFRGTEREKAEHRMESLLFGRGNSLKQDALEIILEMAN